MPTQVNVIPLGNYESMNPYRRIAISTSASLSDISAAGFLNSVSSEKFVSSDVILASYASGSSFGIFTLSISSAGVVTMVPWVNSGMLSAPVVSGNVPKFSGTTGLMVDSSVVAANVLETTTDVTDYQQIVGLNEILIASVGTWTRTRAAQGNYVLRHTAADDTSIIGIDITPALRAATGRGFKLASFDVIYSIGSLALDAHSVTLDKIAYANNVAVAVTSVALTGTLATATQAQPYLSNIVVTTPAFNVTANSKYVAEVTVNAAATSDYDFYGLNLHFTKSVA